MNIYDKLLFFNIMESRVIYNSDTKYMQIQTTKERYTVNTSKIICYCNAKYHPTDIDENSSSESYERNPNDDNDDNNTHNNTHNDTNDSTYVIVMILDSDNEFDIACSTIEEVDFIIQQMDNALIGPTDS